MKSPHELALQRPEPHLVLGGSKPDLIVDLISIQGHLLWGL